MYNKILARWLAGKLSERQLDLLVKTKWLDKDKAKEIKETAKVK